MLWDEVRAEAPEAEVALASPPPCHLSAPGQARREAAWLLGALVVPQLLGFSHGARGAEREWEGGWGGAQEEERRESYSKGVP